ncbi:MAG: SpoIIE family protein phosphatase [Anaerolineales bacterium]|jgi:serine phosphatase RsbU (regulator of sigma subunit)
MPTVELSSIPLFASLPADEIRRLETLLHVSACPPGTVLFQEGHSDDKFYVLLEGQVEVIKALGRPEERLLGVRAAGNLLGEMSLFSRDGCHTASVRSLTPLQLLNVPHTELDALLHRQPQLAYEIIRLLSRRLEESENITILDLQEKNQRLWEAYEELKAAHEQIVEKERLEKELEISGQIQQSLLPRTLPRIPGYEFGALMVPARAVGGDFFTYFKLGRDRLGLVVGDVSDKGVPAALFMALTYSLIRAEAVRTRSPVQAFRNVNRQLLQMNSSNMFVTMVYGILDCSSGDFHFARAGHPSPYLLDEAGWFVDVPVSSGQPLGLFDNLPIDEQHIYLPPGGTLLLYTDGVSETKDIQGSDFAPDLLYQSMAANRTRPALEICEQIWLDVQAHGRGLPQQDDFTAVVVKRLVDES